MPHDFQWKQVLKPRSPNPRALKNWAKSALPVLALQTAKPAQQRCDDNVVYWLI